jgi:outer membrane protein OmpU
MRKILLATTALVGIAAFAPTAQAQTKDSPLNVNIGGYVDFRAGYFTASHDSAPTASFRNHDFETEFKLNVDVDGKATRGIEYGGRIGLTNATVFSSGSGGTGVKTADAYVFLSGAYGKVVLGDHNGASDLFVYAPTVGLGQVDGQYTNFTDPATLTPFQPAYIENGSDYSTKVTYLTPLVGNDKHKVQVGVSYAPNEGSTAGKSGQQVRFTQSANQTRNNLKAAVQYQGNFSPVNVVLSADTISGVGSNVGGVKTRDFTSWGIGGQLAYAGVTVGGSYVDAGSFATVENAAATQDKNQHTWTAGIKYEVSKWAAAFSYMSGKGYNSAFGGAVTTSDVNYTKDFNAYAVGGTYNWFPGMATQLDYVHFSQERADVVSKNAGNVVVLSQKLTF